MRLAAIVLALAMVGAAFAGGNWLGGREADAVIASATRQADSLRALRAQDSLARERLADSLAVLAAREAEQARELAAARARWAHAAATADSVMRELSIAGLEAASAEQLRAALELQTAARTAAEQRAAEAEQQLGTVVDARDLERENVARLTAMLRAADQEVAVWREAATAIRPSRFGFRDGVFVGAAATVLAVLAFK